MDINENCYDKSWRYPRRSDADSKTITLKELSEILHDIIGAKDKMLEVYPNLKSGIAIHQDIKKMLSPYCKLYNKERQSGAGAVAQRLRSHFPLLCSPGFTSPDPGCGHGTAWQKPYCGRRPTYKVEEAQEESGADIPMEQKEDISGLRWWWQIACFYLVVGLCGSSWTWNQAYHTGAWWGTRS